MGDGGGSVGVGFCRERESKCVNERVLSVWGIN